MNWILDMIGMQRWSGRMLAAALVILGTAGCGGQAGGSTSVSTTDSPAKASVAQQQEQGGDEPIGPTRAAVLAGRRMDALVATYGPISRRMNFLVAAETLRADAVAAGAGRAIELERSGAVRIEAAQLQRVLQRTRPRVAQVAARSAAERSMQRSMLASIDARKRAVSTLSAALDVIGRGIEGDTAIDARLDQWRRAWDQSLLDARTATNTMQEERAELGLAPALEESIR